MRCDKITGGVQGEGGLVHWLPGPPVPGLPPHQASVAGTTVLSVGWILLGQGQSRWLVSAFRDAQCHGHSGRAQTEQSQFLGAAGWVIWLSLRAAPGCGTSLQLHPNTLYPPCIPAHWQGRGAAWDSPGGQSHLFTPYRSSSEIMFVLSMPQASCLAHP